MSIEQFSQEIQNQYKFSGNSINLGFAIFNKEIQKNLAVNIPLSTINRHGLIAGATGTGKTKTIQRFAEALSEKGVNVLLMDIKGDVSGIAKPGAFNPKLQERLSQMGASWTPTQYPTELLSISNEKGVRLRATVSEFGPILFSKILELNENQEGAVTIVFKYCDDNKLPLLDIKDFRAALQHLAEGEGKKEIEKNYGSISSATSGVIMRKLLEVEMQGGDKFFGEKSFEVEDLLQKSSDGKAFINILRLIDIQDKPKLFSSFMLCLLAEIYNKFPEQGDKGEPRLVIFIDEAHLIFKEASKTLLQQLETIIKLIRSKGVGIFFCTQSPADIPDSILGQLGAKFQHALRAFTAKDRKDIKLVSENFPITAFYQTDQIITELGIGEAFITVLSEKGNPTALVHTIISPPQSRMDILSESEQEEIVANSEIAKVYNEFIDRQSAYEILSGKINSEETEPEEDNKEEIKNKGKEVDEESGFGKSLKAVANSSVTKTIVKELTRGLFGVLFGTSSRKGSSRRKKSQGFF